MLFNSYLLFHVITKSLYTLPPAVNKYNVLLYRVTKDCTAHLRRFDESHRLAFMICT